MTQIKSKKIIFTVMVSIIGILLFGLINIIQERRNGDVDISKMQMPVVGYKVQSQPIVEKIYFVGNLEANNALEIKSEIEGIIERINFNQGQKVKKGDSLITFNQQKLKAALQQAEANLSLAEVTKDRYKILVKDGAISRMDFDQTTNLVEVNRAIANSIRTELNSTLVFAPFDGIMGQRLVNEGQFISRGESLGFVINQGLMRVNFRVPERYLSQLKEGQSVEVKVEAYLADRFAGKIIFIDPRIDEVSHTVLITAKLINTEEKLRQGMFASLGVILNEKQKAIVIPETALTLKGDDVMVYTVQADDRVLVKSIKLGIRLAGFVEVTEGLEEGDTIIVEGFQKVISGSMVTVRMESR